MLPPLHVKLSAPSEERWCSLKQYADHARRLVDLYVRNLGGVERFDGILDEYRAGFVDETYAS